jgi:hypothetical protein
MQVVRWTAIATLVLLMLGMMKHAADILALPVQQPLLLSVVLLLPCMQVFDLCDGRQVASFQAAADTVKGGLGFSDRVDNFFFNFFLEPFLAALPAQADVMCSDELIGSI